MTIAELARVIQRRLRDDTGRQWKTEYVLEAIDAAFGALCTVLPQAYTEHRTLQLSEGTEQQIDADLHRIVHLLHNVCPDGKPGRSVIKAELDIMDKVAPDWRRDDPRGYIVHYLLNPLDETKFYVWPPASEATNSSARCSVDRPDEPIEPDAPTGEADLAVFVYPAGVFDVFATLDGVVALVPEATPSSGGDPLVSSVTTDFLLPADRPLSGTDTLQFGLSEYNENLTSISGGFKPVRDPNNANASITWDDVPVGATSIRVITGNDFDLVGYDLYEEGVTVADLDAYQDALDAYREELAELYRYDAECNCAVTMSEPVDPVDPGPLGTGASLTLPEHDAKERVRAAYYTRDTDGATRPAIVDLPAPLDQEFVLDFSRFTFVPADLQADSRVFLSREPNQTPSSQMFVEPPTTTAEVFDPALARSGLSDPDQVQYGDIVHHVNLGLPLVVAFIPSGDINRLQVRSQWFSEGDDGVSQSDIDAYQRALARYTLDLALFAEVTDSAATCLAGSNSSDVSVRGVFTKTPRVVADGSDPTVCGIEPVVPDEPVEPTVPVAPPPAVTPEEFFGSPAIGPVLETEPYLGQQGTTDIQQLWIDTPITQTGLYDVRINPTPGNTFQTIRLQVRDSSNALPFTIRDTVANPPVDIRYDDPIPAGTIVRIRVDVLTGQNSPWGQGFVPLEGIFLPSEQGSTQAELDAYAAALSVYNSALVIYLDALATRRAAEVEYAEWLACTSGQLADQPVLPDNPTTTQLDEYNHQLNLRAASLEGLVKFNNRGALSGSLTPAEAVPFDRAHFQPLSEYAMYYSLMRDSEQTPNSGRAMQHWQNFFQLLNARERAELTVKVAEEDSE